MSAWGPKPFDKELACPYVSALVAFLVELREKART